MDSRRAIIERIINRLYSADERTLREIERWVIHWTQFRRTTAAGKEG